MYVQVIQGRVVDASGMRAHMEEWERTLGPGATGWLGTTAGVTDGGDTIALARFESEEAARRNSQRPEQGDWWSRMETFYDGEPSFLDCTLVDVDLAGDPEAAGFVQVMQGRSSDVERARRLMRETPADLTELRPDILGRLWAADPDGEWTMAIYFTSEAAAREGEQKEMPEDMATLMEQLNALETREPRFFDLREPWLSGPG
jgi:hypothetical protein